MSLRTKNNKGSVFGHTSLIVCTFLLLFSQQVQSQLLIQNNPTLKEITDAIVGPGFYIQSSTLNCPNGAFGMFDGVNTNLGINDGVLLTSGSANSAIGPNNTESEGVNNGAPGDNQLDVLSAATTFDGCVLELDLIPSCDTLRIKYVFGSEEYPEFVGQEFNDVFAFFVSGPGIAGSQNVALLPNTTTAVAVNSVNPTTNTNYYVDNKNGNTIQYDGFTTVLEGKIGVQLCETYHLKMAVADVVDGIYESGVFIQGNSIKCNDIVYTDEVRNVSGMEACNDGSFTFCREGDLSQPYDIALNIGGTAINGVDYQTIPNLITIPAGDTCVTIDIIPIDDHVLELDETIEIVYQPGPCPIGDTIVLVLKDPIPLYSGEDVVMCSGDVRKIGKDSIPGATYSWIPVTGITDPTLLQPNITLTNTTNAPITYEYVQVANNGVCDIYDTILVTVHPNPVVEIGLENACVKNTVLFTDNTTPDIGVSWSWDFGDNFLNLNQNTSHSYSLADDYIVSLSVTDTAGCIGTNSRDVEIWELPNPDFSFVEACQGDSVLFTNLSTTVNGSGGGIQKSYWNYGDFTGLDSLTDVSHVFSLAAIYNVELEVVSDSGCVNSIVQPVNIRAKPQADFFGDTVCLNSIMEIEDNSTISNGVIVGYAWDFGDGEIDTSGMDDPEHLFGADGSYDVELIVETGYGCSDTITKEVVVRPLPRAGFKGEHVCVGQKTQFIDTSSTIGNGSIASWKWNFDNTFISQDQHPNVLLSDTGVHNISLVVGTVNGCMDTVDNQSIVLPVPNVEFGPVDVCETEENAFENLSASVYGWDTIVSYSWDFGDGSIGSNDKNPAHTFATLGEYAVTLTVVTDSGCVSEKTKPVYVHGKPEVSFTAEDVCIFSTSMFANTSSVGDGYVKKLYWDFAGQGQDSMIHYPSYYFDSIGNYPVTLIAVSNYGCTDSLTQNVTVNSKPIAVSNAINDHCFGKLVALSGNGSSSANGAITEYVWNYGDGFFSSGINSSYTYPLEGTYSLSLQIKDERGCRDTIADSVNVLGLPEMKVLKDNLCAGDSCQFTLELEPGANFNIASIDWDFGDGYNASNDSAPMHYYNTTGDYNIQVEVVSDSGCVIICDETVQVYNVPFGGFVVDTVCKEDPSKFISQALPPAGSFIKKWEYIFPDGTIGTTSNYNHVFDSAGIFNVMQIVETNYGCRDTVTQIAKVYPIPVLEFNVGSVEGCAPYCATFESDITVENAEVTFTEWDFGDGNISTDTNPTFCFEDEGDFTMSLTVENSFGCSVTEKKESFIKVYPSPNAGFISDWGILSENHPTIQLVNNSVFSTQIQWFFGDGNVATTTGDVSHTYDSVGRYLVEQVVDNSFGCTDTARQYVVVNRESGIYIPNAFTPAVSGGVNDYFYPVVYGELREMEYHMYIYDRWGNLVYTANDLSDYWNGSFLGKQVQEDVYVYKITFLPKGAEDGDYIMYKGHVNVIK